MRWVSSAIFPTAPVRPRMAIMIAVTRKFFPFGRMRRRNPRNHMKVWINIQE
jgi:hypothetical protein